MRAFRTPDGQVLVEWALAETDVLKPDGTPLGTAGTFHLLDASGAIVQSWSTTSYAVQESLTTSAHVVEGDALVCYSHTVDWGHEDHPSLSRDVEIAGLSPLPPEESPSEAAVRGAIERHETDRREGWAEHERVERDRLAGFERALPDLAGDERITLVWRYDGEDVLISRSTGDEIWREPDWPWMGKELYRRLARVAAQKYGERLDRFLVDVPDDEYLRFDNE